MLRRWFLAGAMAASACRVGARSQDDLLVVTGPGGQRHRFTEDDLAGFDWHRIATHTVWTEGLRVFEGPLLRDVLAACVADTAEIGQASLAMRALNDFRIDMPARDAWEFDVILARTMDGAPMRVRDKGPLWVVYPRDDRRELQTALYDERWIWQLCEIQITA
ncbi:molybdopterin-dependent oxidoreductase [Pseudooceanicola nanhaiensis]|uniref:molybdopterin-dependent oxidoreductase n=1 Tax=Pseudooceanicola nanhaiensis TaxID=375761 RepID=UPI001CD5E83D|nr:molybdopterin-dependent oxidoreductase [Pseudooceanicola nanhaiensis]MCA0921987.1 molybdopterin-dependent oxidoreductase [Pseudooceanicola nanhaiensis]